MSEPETAALARVAFEQLPTVKAKFEHILAYAVLAPSSHNTQPWTFELNGDTLELHADRTRSLPTVDPHDRELIVSCGAALYTLRVAMHHFGYADKVHEMPDRRFPGLLARIELGEHREPTERDERRFAAITRRHTNREAFEPQDVPPEVLAILRNRATRERCWLKIVSDDQREDVVDLVAEADRRQASNPEFRKDVAKWLHGNFSTHSDGMPVSLFGMRDLFSFAGPLFVRAFDWGDSKAEQDSELAWISPVLAVLGTPGDEPEDWLAAGEALAGILLEATAADVTASFLNQPCEIPELRARLAQTIGADGFPQLMMRLGYGKQGPGTARRAVTEVLKTD